MLKAINREILRLAVPSILANITIPLVGIVDTAIVGHISDASAIGGIAVGTMLFDLLYWNFGFLRIGTSGLTAQAFGKGQRDDVRCTMVPAECRTILQQSLSLAVVATLFVWAIQWLFVNGVLAVVPCSPQVAEIARRYFYIRIWAAPATLCLMALKGWFIGMQDTRSPMAVDILVNGVNMIASYLLAVNAHLGVAGVAWGTLLAQYSGLVLAIAILAVRYSGLRFRIDEWTTMRHERKAWKAYFRFNGNLFIRSLCFMVVYVGFTSLASRYGDTELAVSSILMKLFMFFSYFVDGFAYAGEALVGKAFGQSQITNLKSQIPNQKSPITNITRSLFAWSIGVGLLFTFIYAGWGDDCIALLTDDCFVLEATERYIGWLIAMPLISTLAFMWDGVFTGATAGREIRNAMIWAAVAFVMVYGVGEWLHEPLQALHMAPLTVLFAAYFAHLIARVVYLTIKWPSITNHK